MKFCYKDHSKSSLCAACPRTDISPSCGVLYCNKVQVVQDCVHFSVFNLYIIYVLILFVSLYYDWISLETYVGVLLYMKNVLYAVKCLF